MRKLSILFMLLIFGSNIYSQQALWREGDILSPEVNRDKTVTFRIQAPNVDSVQITGDFLPQVEMKTPFGNFNVPGKMDFVKGDEGIWSFTSDSIASDIYTYNLIIDGVRTTDPNNVYMVRDVASVFSVFLVEGGKGDLYKVNAIPHGSVVRRWYNSPGLGKTRRMTIYTPPCYENSNEKYPVLYLLHGAGGDEEAWIALGRAAQILDNLIAQGKAKPMIVVMPNGNVSQEAAPGESSQGFIKPSMQLPNTMDGKFEETFMDIVNFIERNYRVKAEKKSRAIAGLSMGGFHSLHISRYYPNKFDYIGLFSPAILPNENVTSKIYEDFDKTLKTQMENGYRLYWIGIGKSDFLYKNVVDYRAKLDKMEMKYTYVETEGGHTWANWRVYLSQFVPLLFQ